MIEFQHPAALLLLPLPLVARLVVPPRRPLAGLVVPERVATLLSALRGRSAWLPRHLPGQALTGAIGWMALVLVLAAPVTGRTPLPNASGRDLMVTLDLSISMLAEDVLLDGAPVSRIEAVKALAGAFIRRREGDRVGLIAFADQPFLIAPPTYDVTGVDAYLSEIDVGLPGRKTAVGDAIGMGVLQLRQQPARARVILLLTDGSSNSGSIAPAEAARIADENGIRIHTIGFGSAQALSPTDLSQLEQLATMTGGRFFPARSTADLQSVYEELDRIEPVVSQDVPRYSQREWSRELILIALAMLLIAVSVEWRTRRR